MRLFVAVLSIFILTLAAFGEPPQLAPGESAVKMEIEGRGDIVFKLFTKEAPKTTTQIMRLVKQGFYNGQKFHRVERQPRPYLAWFGDPGTKTMELDNGAIGGGGSGTRIPYEPNSRTHVVGAVGLAHPVNEKDGGDSQFYFVLGPASFLDGNYTVFGQVISGQDVLKKIERGDKVVNVTVITG